jgi:hypothetical protein
MMAKETTTPTTPATPQDNLVIVDANTLAATIATAVAQAMAAAQNGSTDRDSALASAIAQGIATSTRRKMTYGEYDQLGPRNSYHPKSKAETPTLRREAWQNGYACEESTLMDEEIRLFNRITHSGRYFNRLVEVIADQDAVHIRYNNRTADHRFALKNHFRSLKELLEIVVAQQEAEDKELKLAEEEKREERRKREEAKERYSGFGNSKATREAREKAGVE